MQCYFVTQHETAHLPSFKRHYYISLSMFSKPVFLNPHHLSQKALVMFFNLLKY